MRRAWAIVVLVLAAAAGCTSSSDGGPSSGPPPTSTTPAPPTTSTSAPPTSKSSSPTPTGTAPTLPADVPTTGPNTKPGEKPPIMPVAATQHTAAGARAFAVFFIKTVDWSFASMSGAYIRHYATASCDSCATIATEIDKDRRAGDRYIGGRITTTTARDGSAGSDIVLINIHITAFENVDKKGKFVTGSPASTSEQFEVSPRWRASGWSVARLALNQ